MEENSKLTALVEKKDSEITQLYAELAQKDHTLDSQFQTINKMISEINSAQLTARNDKLAPALSHLRMNDYRPHLTITNMSSNKYAKTPSPTKGVGVQKMMTPDNLHIVASFKVIRTSDKK